MRIIKHLVEQMMEEINGSVEYAKDALTYRDIDKGLADQYKRMADQEYEHATALHEFAVKEIKKAKDQGIEPTPRMLDKWELHHRAMIETQAEAKVFLSMYK